MSYTDTHSHCLSPDDVYMNSDEGVPSLGLQVSVSNGPVMPFKTFGLSTPGCFMTPSRLVD